MDHIPTPTPLNHHAIEIPYLHSSKFSYEYDYEHDYGRWRNFPQRYGWDIAAFYEKDFSYNGTKDNERAASFLQTWLYFGLMVEVFGRPIPTSDFLRLNNRNEPIITTKLLPDYVDDWHRRMELLPSDERKIQLEKTKNFFIESTLLYNFCGDDLDLEDLHPHPARVPLSSEVLLSIAVLHSTLIVAKNRIFQEEQLGIFQTARIIDERLLNNGWCRSDLTWLQDRGMFTCIAMYYASLLGPRAIRKSHDSCAQYRCVAYQVDESDYVTKHVKDDCGCPMVTVSVDEICSIIDKPNGIPIILFKEGSGDRLPILEVIEHKNETEYVALSHVWGEGLGNPCVNGLPVCQLERIQSYVNGAIGHINQTMKGSAPFWMDTLCVPVHPQFKGQRGTAIKRMAKIYRQATLTLVLSAELESTSIHIPEEELAMRVTCHSWWRRLWTLHEAVLAHNLLFQLLDGVVGSKDLIARFQKSSQEKSSRITSELIFEGLKPLYHLESMRSKPARERANDLWDTVMWRSTSRQTDEAICLASIMGLETGEVVDAKGEDKLKTFILLQRHFRSDFIFRLGARMEEDGFGWAPITFTFNAIPDATQGTSSPLAWADKYGLHVQYTGLLFPVEGLSLDGGKVLFVTQDGARYRVDLFLNDTKRVTFKSWKDGIWPSQQSWSEMCSSRGIRRGALIIKDWPLKPDHIAPEPKILDSNWENIFRKLVPDYKPEPVTVYRPTQAVIGFVTEDDPIETPVRFYATANVSRSILSSELTQFRLESHVIDEIEFKHAHNWCVL